MLLALTTLLLAASPEPAPLPAKLPVWHTADQLFATVQASAKESHKPVIVHFWATWCEACVRELSELRDLERTAKDLGVPVWWVSLDAPKDVAKVAAFMGQHHLLAAQAGHAVLLDAPDSKPITSRFSARWQAELPATFVVLESGAVAASYLGPTPVDVVLKEVRGTIRAQPANGAAPPTRRTK